MQKILATFITFLVCFSFSALANNPVEPLQILEPPFPGLYYRSPNPYYPYTTLEPEIMWLKCDNQNLLCNFIYVQPFTDAYQGYAFYEIDWSASRQYSFQSKSYSDPIILFEGVGYEQYWNPINGLIRNASSVTIDNEKIYLSNLHPEWIKESIDCNWKDALLEACLSFNQNYILGLSKFSFFQEHHYNDISAIRIWDATNGGEIPGVWRVIGEGYHEIYESPQKRYVIVRFFPRSGATIDFDKLNKKYTYGPHSLLYDLSNLRILDANRDVAFTQDDKYFVTERDGLPTLVLAQTDGNLRRYPIPSPMISATFSPDGQRLYIAGANSKVYVYESGIDSHVSEWELMK